MSDEPADLEADLEPELPGLHRGPSTSMRKVRDAKPLLATRGHYCLSERRGEKCPGCSTSHEATPEELANPCNKSGVRDGVRCSGCGQWGETAKDIRHTRHDCVEEWEPMRRPQRPPTTPLSKPLSPLPAPATNSGPAHNPTTRGQDPAEGPLTMKPLNLSKPGEKRCAHPSGCTNPVDDDHHCAGCGFYICEEHSSNVEAGGHGHEVVDHWTDPDED